MSHSSPVPIVGNDVLAQPCKILCITLHFGTFELSCGHEVLQMFWLVTVVL